MADETKTCGACSQDKGLEAFSKKQWAKKKFRRCIDCVNGCVPMAEEPSQTPDRVPTPLQMDMPPAVATSPSAPKTDSTAAASGGAASDPDIMEELGIKLGLDGSISIPGNQRAVFVSEGLEGKIQVGKDGTLEIKDWDNASESDSNDDEEREDGKAHKLGHCANPKCPLVSSADGTDLMRCTRCWRVEYCSKDCQSTDWKRHKHDECNSSKTSRGEEKGSKSALENRSWQFLAYKGEQALLKSKFSKAVKYLRLASKKAPSTSLFFADLAEAELQSGRHEDGLKNAYTACQVNCADPRGFVVKAKCHMALGQTEAALLTIYSCINSHYFMRMEKCGDEKVLRFKRKSVDPLYQEILGVYMHDHLPKSLPRLSPSDFPLSGHRIASVPFTIALDGGRVGLIQDLVGTGWHTCHPESRSTGTMLFPQLKCHTAVARADSETIVVFGGSTPNCNTNAVVTFRLNPANADTYRVEMPRYSGDAPPPMQGHAACVIGRRMYVFGGVFYDEFADINMPVKDMFVLDLESWTWTLLPSMQLTPESERPEIGVCFCTITPLSRDSFLLVGGRRLVPTKEVKMGGIDRHIYDESKQPCTSDNMHVFSLASKKWSRFNFAGAAPRVWGHSAHRMNDGRILLFGGNSGLVTTNAIHILDPRTNPPTWTEIGPSFAGLPPSLSRYRSAAWLSTEEKLVVVGGLYEAHKLTDSVLKAAPTEGDVNSLLCFDTEIYIFCLKERQWTRLRVPESVARSSHTVVASKLRSRGSASKYELILLGGTIVSPDAPDQREYAEEVLRFEVDFRLKRTPASRRHRKSNRV